MKRRKYSFAIICICLLVLVFSACGSNKQGAKDGGVANDDVERPSANVEQHSASQDDNKETVEDETVSDTYEELISGTVSGGSDSEKENEDKDKDKDSSESNVSDDEKSDFEISEDTETKYGKIHE